MTEEKEKRNTRFTLTKGHLYRIGSRNLPYGVYDGRGGFIGVREKFGHLYLFTEYDWDNGPPFGTVIVREDLGAIPSDIEPVEAWWVQGEHRWPSGTPQPDGALLKDAHYEQNKRLYEVLEAAEKAHGRGIGYGGRPGDESPELR